MCAECTFKLSKVDCNCKACKFCSNVLTGFDGKNGCLSGLVSAQSLNLCVSAPSSRSSSIDKSHSSLPSVCTQHWRVPSHTGDQVAS